MNRTISIFTVFALLFLNGCDFGSDADPAPLAAETVLVVNSGNFSDQNGSLTTYDITGDHARDQTDLGGFIQQIRIHGDRTFVLVNTFSVGRIDVLDAASLERIGQIGDLPAPRDLAFAGGMGWVSNLVFGEPGTVVAFDPETFVLSDPIPVGITPEGIASAGGRIWVANHGSLGDGRKLSVIDPSSSSVVDEVSTGCDGPKDLYPTGDRILIVVCTGKTVYNADFSSIIETTPGQIVFVDIGTGGVDGRIVLSHQTGSSNGTESGFYSPGSEELFVLQAAHEVILVIDPATRSVKDRIDVPVTAGYTGLSGIAFDVARDELYVSRLPLHPGGGLDYTGRGTVLRLRRDGTILGSFPTGPSPSVIRLADPVGD